MSETLITGDIFVFSPPRQTLLAWQPYADCVGILFSFQNSDTFDGDDELPEWRISWVAGVALLRTIGHVLSKVDAKTSERHRDAINGLWAELKFDRDANRIFWNFIEKERNSILKTYQFGARPNHDEDGHYISMEDDRDAFQLFREAVYWWRLQLIKIEDFIAA
jgi:hypothetical protein